MSKTEEVKKKKVIVQEKTVQRCQECGFRIRSKNHEKGDHHNSGKKGKCSVKNGY